MRLNVGFARMLGAAAEISLAAIVARAWIYRLVGFVAADVLPVAAPWPMENLIILQPGATVIENLRGGRPT